jgi:DNA-binding NtrC family response regulator
MSSEPIHSRDPVSHQHTDLSTPKGAGGSDFEQFLVERLGQTLDDADREPRAGTGTEPASLRAWLDQAEAWKITKTLRECRGNRSAAARKLGIGRRTLYAKMEKLQIAPTWAIRDRPLDG